MSKFSRSEIEILEKSLEDDLCFLFHSFRSRNTGDSSYLLTVPWCFIISWPLPRCTPPCAYNLKCPLYDAQSYFMDVELELKDISDQAQVQKPDGSQSVPPGWMCVMPCMVPSSRLTLSFCTNTAFYLLAPLYKAGLLKLLSRALQFITNTITYWNNYKQSFLIFLRKSKTLLYTSLLITNENTFEMSEPPRKGRGQVSTTDFRRFP